MRVSEIRVEDAPTPQRVRLLADVVYDDRPSEPETYWFDFPADYRDEISTSGNPWLVALAPLAVTLSEPLHLEAPVDLTLLANVEELMQVWKCWYSPLKPVPIHAEIREDVQESKGKRIASFFSGGVDAFFTVLRHDDPQHLRQPSPVDDLLTVWGFDIPLDKPGEFECMRTALSKAAGRLEKGFIDIATNLRTTRWREAHWGRLAHGCGLGSIALSLERRFGKVMIGSGSGYVFLQPWGSHYVTDPLLSTSKVEIRHDGSGYDRIAKTAYIASNEVARHSLHVCWKHGAANNCSECGKCVRTMLTLEAMGQLDGFSTFRGGLDTKELDRLYVKGEVDAWHLERICSFAQERYRDDIVRYIKGSLGYSKRLNQWLPLIDRLERTRVGRIGRHMRSRVMADVIS